MKSINRAHKGIAGRDSQGHYGGEGIQRRAVGYVRVSTDMQASEGMSLDAQQSAIEGYCALHGIKLVKICKDVISGGKDVRPGLQEVYRFTVNLTRRVEGKGGAWLRTGGLQRAG